MTVATPEAVPCPDADPVDATVAEPTALAVPVPLADAIEVKTPVAVAMKSICAQ